MAFELQVGPFAGQERCARQAHRAAAEAGPEAGAEAGALAMGGALAVGSDSGPFCPQAASSNANAPASRG